MRPVLLDTGVIVALLDRSEPQHDLCATRIQSIDAALVTCEAVIAETCYLLRHLPGAADAILENVEAGIFQIPFRLSEATPAVRRIFRKYRDREIDLADACLIHIATEMHTGEILTLDSDFKIYRWGVRQPFHLLVPLS